MIREAGSSHQVPPISSLPPSKQSEIFSALLPVFSLSKVLQTSVANFGQLVASFAL